MVMPAPETRAALPLQDKDAEPPEGILGRALNLASLLLGFDKSGLPVGDVRSAPGLGWIAPISLLIAGGLMLVSLAQVTAMHGGQAPPLYWTGIVLITFPVSFRIALPRASRSERLTLILLMAVAFYAVKILYSPLNFALFDEFLHWNTALNIQEQGHLFGSNSLLPISRLFPGLEIVTTALSSLSGLSIFASGIILIGVVRAAFVSVLFLAAETLSGSSRVAALACIVFMSNSNFSAFQAQFSYESLAFALMSFAFLTALRLIREERDSTFYLLAGLCFAAATAVTHHLTSYFTAALLTALAVLRVIEGRLDGRAFFLVCLAAASVGADIAWLWITGSSGSYLGPTVERGFREFADFLTSSGSGRTLFAGPDGSQQPLWEKLTAMASTLLICLGLALGFFRSLNLAGVRIERKGPRIKIAWNNSGLVLLTLLTLGFPLSVLLRLTQSGWEIGNRLGPFVSLGVCVVVAIAIAGLWQEFRTKRQRPGMIASALTITVLGGFVLGWGPTPINYPYKVEADGQSIEPLGIGAAEWTREWLGPGQRFATDRINRVLLATYGRQIPITSLHDKVDITAVLFAPVLGEEELRAIKEAMTGYVMIDLRLTTALPVGGVYFEGGEDPRINSTPPEPAALLKFNKISGVSRPFDNGATIIYDVRPLNGGS